MLVNESINIVTSILLFCLFDKLWTFISQFHGDRAVPAVFFVYQTLALAGHQQVAEFERPEDDVILEFQHFGRLVRVIPKL